MGRRVIIWLCVATTLAFIGLIVMQTSWIMQAVRVKENHFDQLVRQSIDDVVSRLETDEVSSIKSQLQGSSNLMPLFRRQSKANKSLISTDEIVKKYNDYNISLDLDMQGHFTINTYNQDSLISVLDGKMDIDNVAHVDPLAAAMISIQNELRDRITEQSQTLLHTVFEDIPIEQRVNQQRVDALLMGYLEERGITETYEFAITNSKGKIVINTPGYRPAENDKIYQKNLYPSDIHVKQHSITVYFPEEPSFIMELQALFIPTVLITLVMIYISCYTLVIVFRQRKLDVIKNDFINNMTHELKTPISTKSLASQMLKD